MYKVLGYDDVVLPCSDVSTINYCSFLTVLICMCGGVVI